MVHFESTALEARDAKNPFQLWLDCGHRGDFCGVIVEILARAPCVRNKSGDDVSGGGRNWEKEICQMRKIANYKMGAETRWCAPWDMIAMAGLWIRDDALSDLAAE